MRTATANPLLEAPARPLPRRVAIVGAGTIGPDIGYYLATAIPGLELVLVDVAQAPLDQAIARYEGYIAKGLARRKLTEAQAAAVRQNTVTTLDYGAMADADWVIEAATERLDIKRRIFSEIEAVVRADAVITSNTSSLPAERLFGHLEHPGRTAVTHFFAPAWRNPAVEVIRWDQGDPDVLAWLRWVFCATGKVPLVTTDVICFMLDRVFDNWCNDAALLLDRASAREIDAAAMALVHAGPFFVLNLAQGNPIIWETNTLQMEEGAHYQPAQIFRSVAGWNAPGPRDRIEVDPDTAAVVADRLRGVLFSQSFDIVDRGIGSSADLDLGCVLALGFKKGPLQLMEELGADEVRRIADQFATDRPGMPGPRQDLAAYTDFRRYVLVDDLDGVKVLTLRRPQALNALDDRVTDELLSAIVEHENDPSVQGFVIVGYGTAAFCAGADIGRFPAVLGDPDGAAGFARDCSRLLVHLDGMHKPVVAALNGMALGGGLELALRCHGIVAQRSAWMQFPEVTLGIAPGIGGMAVPYRRWPQAAATFHDMLRLARRLDATEAHALGVVDGLADSYAGLVTLAVERVRALAGAVRPPRDAPVELEPLPPVEARAGKQVLSAEVIAIIEHGIAEAAGATSFTAALESGYRAFARTACTAAAREGIAAFGEKRRPDFTSTG